MLIISTFIYAFVNFKYAPVFNVKFYSICLLVAKGNMELDLYIYFGPSFAGPPYWTIT